MDSFQTPDILNVTQMAGMLGCAVSTVEERARTGDLPGLKFGDGGWIFPRRAVLERLYEKSMARITMTGGQPHGCTGGCMRDRRFGGPPSGYGSCGTVVTPPPPHTPGGGAAAVHVGQLPQKPGRTLPRLVTQ